MRYFHIQRINGIRKEWNLNEIGTTDEKDFNDFFVGVLEGIKRLSKPKFDGKRLFAESRKILNEPWLEELDNKSDNYKKLFFQSQDYSSKFNQLSHELFESHHQYLKWIREEIFDKTREQIDSQLPSRKKCIWLCDEKNIEFWWETISNSQKRKIIELEINNRGKFHIADENHVNIETYSIQEFKELSIKYWNGEMDVKPNEEILYEGNFKVINEFDNISDL